ncbi:hypothetical protein HGRIS_005648 [Hohenbuehelia grisea]|uniref:F-actin-capping protein subunit alpha n=1 Tax=Hohenbuehelia grisea TaxID=104357 RepID=A0ABR3JZR5_9AGAR
MDSAERIAAASKFLLQSPPGEINDVLNDVRNIISDDESLQDGVRPALRDYNLQQFMTVNVPGTNHQSIISDAARLPSSAEGEPVERYLDPRSKTSFVFDHLSLEASEPQEVEPDGESEPFRTALEASTLQYLVAHYEAGVACAFSTPDSPQRFVIQIVSNKYNPANYWSGRWRSEYVIDFNENTIEGKILVNVHYYEQGNVQLATTHNISTKIPPAVSLSSPNPSANKLLATIEHEEALYQKSLDDSYEEMAEKTFKGLRRVLPLTRQKIDWDKLLGYKLGAEIASSKGGFSAGS